MANQRILAPGFDPTLLQRMTQQHQPQQKPPPFKARMEEKRKALEKDLEKVNTILARLEKNPEIEEFLNFIEGE